jgi:hypothetical protein
MKSAQSDNIQRENADSHIHSPDGAHIHPIPPIPIITRKGANIQSKRRIPIQFPSAKIEFSNCTELTLRYPNRTERYWISEKERHRVSSVRLELVSLGRNSKPKIIKSPRQIIRTLKRLATDWEILWDDGGIGASFLK